jgi:hypothetical protein
MWLVGKWSASRRRCQIYSKASIVMISAIVVASSFAVLLFVLVQWARFKLGGVRIDWPEMPKRWPSRGEVVDAALFVPQLAGVVLRLAVGLTVVCAWLLALGVAVWGGFWLLHSVVAVIAWLWRITG